MARKYGVQKIDLDGALRLLTEIEPIGYVSLVREIAAEFDCAERTAEDALTVLRRGGWIETTSVCSTDRAKPLIDSSRRHNRVSERGHYVLNHPNGHQVLQFARKLFTASPSPKVKRTQRSVAQRGGLAEWLQRVERGLLTAPRRF
jgi:hypothetical protein